MNISNLQVSIAFIVAFISVSCSKTESIEKIQSLTANKYASMHRSHAQNPVVGQTERLSLQKLFRQRRTSNSNGHCTSLSSYNKRVTCDLHYQIVDLSNSSELTNMRDTSRSLHFNVSRCVGKCQNGNLFCLPGNVTEECILVPMYNNKNSKITLYHHTRCGRVNQGTKCSSTTSHIDDYPVYKIENEL